HLVHELHRLDDPDRLAGVDRVPLFHERRSAGLRGAVERADERGLDRVADLDVDGPATSILRLLRSPLLADDDARAALDLDLRVAGLDGEPLHRAALESFD